MQFDSYLRTACRLLWFQAAATFKLKGVSGHNSAFPDVSPLVVTMAKISMEPTSLRAPLLRALMLFWQGGQLEMRVSEVPVLPSMQRNEELVFAWLHSPGS